MNMRRWFRSKPRVSVSIITRDSERILTRAVAQARRFADEVVVGIDAASSDRTWEVACELADTVYRFRHPDQLAPAHMLALRYCRGDWILRLDDDEYMEAGFEKVLPDLLKTSHFTHYYLSRKLVVSENPPLYVRRTPWYPDYQLRLFRNDPSLVWKPPRFHTGYHVAGQGGLESRCSILHYEALLCSVERRKEKMQVYRNGGGKAENDAYYDEKIGEMRTFEPLSECKAERAKRSGQRIDPETHVLQIQQFPGWGCHFKSVDLPAKVQVSENVVVALVVKNTGTIAWLPHCEPSPWPFIKVGFHIKSDSGKAQELEGGRVTFRAHVAPGGTAQILGTFPAPAEPGHYSLCWDMVSEHECWFKQCGSTPFHSLLEVV